MSKSSQGAGNELTFVFVFVFVLAWELRRWELHRVLRPVKQVDDVKTGMSKSRRARFVCMCL